MGDEGVELLPVGRGGGELMSVGCARGELGGGGELLATGG